MKKILSRFMEDQTHFGMPRGARLSLTLTEPKLVALGSTSNTNSKHAPQVEVIYSHGMENNQCKS